METKKIYEKLAKVQAELKAPKGQFRKVPLSFSGGYSRGGEADSLKTGNDNQSNR